MFILFIVFFGLVIMIVGTVIHLFATPPQIHFSTEKVKGPGYPYPFAKIETICEPNGLCKTRGQYLFLPFLADWMFFSSIVTVVSLIMFLISPKKTMKFIVGPLRQATSEEKLTQGIFSIVIGCINLLNGFLFGMIFSLIGVITIIIGLVIIIRKNKVIL